MAEWSKNKVEPIEINGGQEFVKGDNLALDELNTIVNNSFYASDKSTRAEQLAESAVKGNGTLVTIGGQIQGEWSADFAESERLKSKNLFNPNGMTIGQSTYGYFYIGNASSYTISIRDNDTSVDISGIYFGFTENGVNASGQTPVWIVSNNYVEPDYVVTSSTMKYFSFYPNNEETLNKIIQRFNVQIEEGVIVTDYVPYQGGKFIQEEQLNTKAVTLVDSIYIPDETYTTIDLSGINFKPRVPYLIEMVGGVSSANDGKIMINNSTSNYSILTETAYDGASAVSVEENETHIPSRFDKYFSLKIFIDNCTHYSGSATFFKVENYSVPTSSAGNGKYTRNSQGVVSLSSVKSIQIQSTSSFLRGTTVKIYKYGE